MGKNADRGLEGKKILSEEGGYRIGPKNGQLQGQLQGKKKQGSFIQTGQRNKK